MVIIFFEDRVYSDLQQPDNRVPKKYNNALSYCLNLNLLLNIYI